MAWACILGIHSADAGNVPGNLRIDVSIVFSLTDGQKHEFLISFDNPISNTNWKNVIADYCRARAENDWSDPIAPNDILYCDWSRG